KFKTLASLLKRAGLVRTLEGKGPYTVFAPTDAAFAKVPKATLAGLARNRAKLRSVLLLHVAKGRLSAAKVTERRSVKTLNGQRLEIRVRGSKVFVGGARVVTPDVTASNGVIHVINKVLIPS
ncbi:MAG TPA: fasciclin domain-containing protein, partial [Solirubrobacteraceae bacterium]|nr:fasciclin domain-containing protein [Solirubrobacteraceae bacterium]